MFEIDFSVIVSLYLPVTADEFWYAEGSAFNGVFEDVRGDDFAFETTLVLTEAHERTV